MSKRVEIEQKYYCDNHEKLLKIIEQNKLKKVSEEYESDEYLEVTFKGKSKEFTNNYAKWC